MPTQTASSACFFEWRDSTVEVVNKVEKGHVHCDYTASTTDNTVFDIFIMHAVASISFFVCYDLYIINICSSRTYFSTCVTVGVNHLCLCWGCL